MTEVLAISIGVALAGGLTGLAFGCIIGRECSPNWDLLRKLEQENKELKQQIEKMKCCQNCENWTWNMSNKKCQFRCESREACDNWEIKENE